MKTRMFPFASMAARFLVFPWLKVWRGITIVFAANLFAISTVLSSEEESTIISSHGLVSCAESIERRFSIYGPALNVGMMSEILINIYFIIPVHTIRSGAA